jgi:UDP:flavonoid glycosyltransferase YjiC (YdhE family)
VSSILIVVPPMVGHVNPTVPLGCELAARGHDVTWAGLPGLVDELLPEGAQFVPVTGGLDDAAYADLYVRSLGLRGVAALKFLWEDLLIPLARATAPELDRAIDRLRPDLLVVDQQAVGAAAVARRRGVPWVTSASNSSELTDPLAGLPVVAEWVRDQLHGLQIDLGVDPSDAAVGDLRFSEQLVLAFTTEELAGRPEVPGLAPRVRFVGPCLASRPERATFDWDWLDPATPLVLVSLGTVNADVGDRFFAVVVEALAKEPVQAVLVAPLEHVSLGAAQNIKVAPHVPQLALLSRCSAVVTHGGHNTVCEALAHNLPLVVAPIRDDQPLVAEQVVRAGAGVRVRFGRVQPEELRTAVERVLSEPSFRDAAAGIARSFEDAGGARAAADAIESCLLEVVR